MKQHTRDLSALLRYTPKAARELQAAHDNLATPYWMSALIRELATKDPVDALAGLEYLVGHWRDLVDELERGDV